MKIPVFHDDQHGTAIIVGAAVLNGLRVVGKKHRRRQARVLGRRRRGARLPRPAREPRRAAARTSTCRDHQGRRLQGPQRGHGREQGALCADDTHARTLGDVIHGADIFLGLSAGGVLKPEMVKRMAARPLILALANPDARNHARRSRRRRGPTRSSRPGRSDYPNQVNNVLCFPFIFRGALDVGATTINEAMKLAAVRAIADAGARGAVRRRRRRLRRAEACASARDYLIPQAVRSAPDRRRSRRRSRRPRWKRRRDAADRRPRRLSRDSSNAVRLSVRQHHEADVRGARSSRRKRDRLRRRRGRARAARRAGRRRREARASRCWSAAATVIAAAHIASSACAWTPGKRLRDRRSRATTS